MTKPRADVSDEEKLERLMAELATIEQRMTKYHNAIRTLNTKLGADEAKKRKLSREAHELQNQMFVHWVVESPEFQKVRSARDRYLQKLSTARSMRITVARKNQLEDTLKSDLVNLQSTCKHPLVFSYDGYRGSASDDWDDARHGHRVCVVCNLRETSGGTDKDIYVQMPKDETRLVLRDLRREENLPSAYQPEWHTIAFLEELFARSAGSNNIDWPEAFDQKVVFAK